MALSEHASSPERRLLVKRYACEICFSAAGEMCLGPPKCVGNEAAMARRQWKSDGRGNQLTVLGRGEKGGDLHARSDKTYWNQGYCARLTSRQKAGGYSAFEIVHRPGVVLVSRREFGRREFGGDSDVHIRIYLPQDPCGRDM
jgi:hypothetical protein